MTDAREFLNKDLQSLRNSEPGIGDEEIYQHFVSTFGDPEAVAAQYEDAEYEDAAKSPRLKTGGYAPGWRISCTKCGRSAPAAKAGITRIGARSSHKYVVGWCSDCRWLRWMRLERDLDRSNLMDSLGSKLMGDQLRQRKHKPWTVVLAILASAFILLAAGKTLEQVIGAATADQADATFANLPPGWTIVSEFNASSKQLTQFSKSLGGNITSLSNTVISDGDRQLQINVIRCANDQDAEAVHRAIAKTKPNSRDVYRNEKMVYEFVCRSSADARFAAEARYRLPIQARQSTYRVRFDAAPIAGGDAMQWNKMFNLFLNWNAASDRREVESQIAELAKRFQLSQALTLKKYGLGSVETEWAFTPAARGETESDSGDATRFEFENLPTRAGVPFTAVTAIVTSVTLATAPASDDAGLRERLTRANQRWPADDPEIRELAKTLVHGAVSDEQKLRALLDWFAHEQNIRVGGETGSRYGTRQVLRQKFGNCWDYSDVLITFCRANGIPARQVAGWLHQASGHVWAEVLINGRWQQIDPTTGFGCGSDYLPLVVSDDGEISYIYASPVEIELLSSK